MLNRSEPNVILTAHATKVNRPEPNWTEPQTCLAGRNHAFTPWQDLGCFWKFRVGPLNAITTAPLSIFFG